MPCIFDLFTQAERSLDRSLGGLGVGLWMVRRLVELHGGDLDIRSRLGQGTSVIVRLPLDCEKAQAVEPASNVERLPVPEPISVPVETRVKKRA